MTPSSPPQAMLDRVGRLAGAAPASWQPVSGGWTMAARWVVRFADGTSAFVKAATDADTADWLRREHRMYSSLSGTFMAALLAFDEGDGHPLLMLEDLSGAHWPPPWSATRVDQVLAAIEMIHGCRPPPGLPALEEQRAEIASWERVAAAPEPFLALGLCSAEWLERALPDLIAADAAVVVGGNDLLHLDVRSDNLCFRDGRALLVDWNWACRGNSLVDIAGWLPSLHAEGGPAPEAILPDQPALAALLAGMWAYRAGLPPPQPGSRVREVQRKQLRAALPWAARALGLPPPDGPTTTA